MKMNSDIIISQSDWLSAKCDKYDILIAASCGALAGLMDIFFVGSLGNIPCIESRNSKLGKMTDQMVDDLVKKFAGMIGWNPKPGNEDNIGSAINFLERKYKVNYDQTALATAKNVSNMTPRNHHYKSLSHAPDVVGLFFSVLDQFMSTSSFVDEGKVIRIDTRNNNFRLEGKDFPSKLYCGFCNWMGHLISDMAGSSNRKKEDAGRGMGISLPFMELFQFFDFGQNKGDHDGYTLALLMTEVYDAGYDLRSGTAAAIPVVLEELMIRVLWSVKKHYYEKRKWKECVPINNCSDLRIMLIIGNTALCLLDFGDAAIHYGMTGGNPVVLVLHMNIPAWTRLIMFVFRELRLRFGVCVDAIAYHFLQEILYCETDTEKRRVISFYQEIQESNDSIEDLLRAYGQEIEEEYRKKDKEFGKIFDEKKSREEQMAKCIDVARNMGVPEDNIIKSREELDRRMNRGSSFRE